MAPPPPNFAPAPVPAPTAAPARPACVSRLRIAGFKTFADPVALDVPPGLTGLVGPNGCGKSNVVDALRWAMGEGSARTLRGAEMEDVIFAGTAARPGLDGAEVALTLDGGSFPAPFANLAAVQVTRRIGRGSGSSYQVNGRDARARDVQALFADLAGGARSFAMVGQGRVGALVQARPDERRGLLDEAAGIAGLHARRAEAEGKLRAAEANLLRVGDRRHEMDAQLETLHRQARQAERHRELSLRVAAAEAGLLALVRARAAAARDAAAAALAAARQGAAHAASQAAAAVADAATAAAAIPPLRRAEAEARAIADRARLAQEGQAAAATRAREALAAAAARLAQTARDLAHAEGLARDATDAGARLAAESLHLAEQEAADPARLAAQQADAAQAARAVREAEAAATAAVEHAAALAAEARAATAALAQADARNRRATDAAARLGAERDRAIQAAVDPAQLAAAVTEAERADTALPAAGAWLDAAAQAVAPAAAAAARAREAASGADAAQARLAAEAEALAEMLAVDGDAWPSILDEVQVPPGLEAALGAALGDDLAASGDAAAPRYWRGLPALPLRPAPGQALAALLQAPPVLHRALSGVGVVADDAEGDAAQAGLLPGQCLVSRAGALWRWDGFTVCAGTPAVAATRLRQRNRLAELRTQLRGTAAVVTIARAAKTAAGAGEQAAAAAEAQARAGWRDADAWASRARRDCAALQAASDAAAAALARLDAQAAALALEAAEAAAALDQARAGRAALPEVVVLEAEAARARAALDAARASDAAAARELDAALRDGAARRDRLAALAQERDGWAVRAGNARRRADELRARWDAAQGERAHLLAEQAGTSGSDELAAALRRAVAGQRAAAVALAGAERHADEAAGAARAADAVLAQARDALVRAEAAAGQAAQAWAALPPGPDAAPPRLSADAEARARAGLAALLRERDALGPVNPHAEGEAAAAEGRSQAVARECGELAASIAALRGSLARLDQDARARLSAVFGQVDREFQALFSRMFGGGRAQLALVGPDDPLQAGLDVVAQPPGKARARLSLLSGGEQALTALCLLFAVFRCNPAPLCVLDEVDAPLDDANVGRFCDLLADMARDGGTRFLVVTHHGLTMARMDRLLGVTMGERGVSQLLSVDLRQAEAWAGDKGDVDRPALRATRS